MTPQAYCARLEQALSSMPPAERQEIIRYYLEFLEDASEDERSALGTPEELAKVKKSYTGQYVKQVLKQAKDNGWYQ